MNSTGPGGIRSAGFGPGWRIEPLGDRCLVVEFESRVDEAINRKARALAAVLLSNPPAGVVDVVPAFCTVAVYYRPERFEAARSPFQQLRMQLAALLQAGVESAGDPGRVVSLPVCYGGAHGPDLDDVARACGMTSDEVVEAHVASSHVVFMLGFSPGFPYIGGLDPRLSVPRRSTPRTHIPAGSVAIAREQTAVYTFETPGGWSLIGRTPLSLFDPGAEPPCRLQAGDRIRFVPITPEAFDAHARQPLAADAVADAADPP